MPVLQVFLLRNGAFEGTEMVSGERVEVGSDPACDLVLDDPSCAPRHASFVEREGRLVVEDRGFGIAVNGERVRGARVVGPRDDVTIGVFTLKVRVMAASRPPAVVPSAPPSHVPATDPRPLLDDGTEELPLSVSAPPVVEATVPLRIAAPSTGDLPPQAATEHGASAPKSDLEPAVSFAFAFVEEDDDDAPDEDPAWSLVDHLARFPFTAAGKARTAQVIHHRGEHVVDHVLLSDGDTFVLGSSMSADERLERGIDKPVPIVRVKGGAIELLALPHGPRSLVDGEAVRFRVGDEELLVRVAEAPALVWSKEDRADARTARRVHVAATATSSVLFAAFFVVSWIYQFRNAAETIVPIEDVGFAEVVIPPPKMEEPPPPPEKPKPKPVKVDATPEKAPPPKSDKPKNDGVATAPQAPAKANVLDILKNIPQLQDSAPKVALDDAMKAVRVTNADSGPKVSALVGKAPSSGVQIGGGAGGVATSGINSLLRKDGSAGALGGKSDRAVSGKVTALPRQITKSGGDLSKDDIQRVVNAALGKIQYCYEKELQKQPGLAGRLLVEWTVKPDGSVTSVKRAQSSVPSAAVESCIMGIVRGLKFPQPKGGSVVVSYPFMLNPM